MLVSYLENITKNLVSEISPSPQRYLTYFFMIIGILWWGGALNYYFIDENIKFRGALFTGLMFFFLSAATALWEYYMSEKTIENKDNINEMIVKTIPLALPVVFDIIKKVRLPIFSFKTIGAAGIIGAVLYYGLRHKNNKF